MTAARMNRTEKLDLRLTPSAKQALRMAAEASHKTVSDFVMESALSRADEVLADRRIISLSAEGWQAFQEALDAPRRQLPRLGRLASTKTLLD